MMAHRPQHHAHGAMAPPPPGGTPPAPPTTVLAQEGDPLEPSMACGPRDSIAGALAPSAGAGSTLFGAPGTLASGRRRYTGSGGPSGSPAARRRAHHRAAVAALGYRGGIGSPSTPGYACAPSPATGRPA